jgi:hypothetical protein
MQLVHLPLLRVQRELYAQPRGLPRFHEYLSRMIGSDGDLRLPLTAMNPMGKDHLAKLLDEWLALGAEDFARGAVTASQRQVESAPGKLQVALVLADDVAGGWTNRYTTDFSHRFESQGLLTRDFAVALLWASEKPRESTVFREVLLSIGRAVWQRTRGLGRTLRDLLHQERFALKFAGEEPKAMPARHLDATDAPTLFAALYGDEAAVSLGYSPLGVDAAL